jgi:SAM-dependent methyltransferase
MHLRNGLLLFSTLMIGFCLLLYFQPNQSVSTFNWDHYKNIYYNEEQSHSLTGLNDKLAPRSIQEMIKDIHEKNLLAGEKTRIMQIGIGNGRVLMRLKKIFPDVEFYGIKREKSHAFYRRESFILTALKYEIMTRPELESTELPYVVFTELDFGSRIPYNDNKFDLIYSQDVMRHIKFKFELWTEILRILKPTGISVHTEVSGINIYSKGIIIETRDIFRQIKKLGLDITFMENPQTVIIKKKNIKNFSFPLSPHQSIPKNIEALSEEQKRPEMGYNLVY